MTFLYRAFGLEDTVLRINTLGDEQSRPRYKEALQAYFEPHQDALSETSRQRLERNPLRILDTKDERERALLDEAPLLLDFIDDESRRHYEDLKALLSGLGLAFGARSPVRLALQKWQRQGDSRSLKETATVCLVHHVQIALL